MNSSTRMAIWAGVVMLTAFLANAHHGWIEFDATREITLTGTATDFHFANPHCVIEFDATTDGKGAPQKWQAEFSSPGPMAKKGWTASSVEPGDAVTISGHPARNGVHAVHATRIRLANGKEFKIEDGR